MPYKTNWDTAINDLFHIAMIDDWTWDEFREVTRLSYDFLSKLERKVDLIIAFNSDLPTGSAIMHFIYVGDQPENIRHTAVLNATSLTTKEFIKTIIGTVDRMKGWYGPKFVETVEEARSYFKTIREENS